MLWLALQPFNIDVVWQQCTLLLLLFAAAVRVDFKNILNFRPPVSRLSAPFSILIRCSIATVLQQQRAVPPLVHSSRARFAFARVAYFRCPKRQIKKQKRKNQAKCQGKKIQLASSLSTHKYRTLHTHTPSGIACICVCVGLACNALRCDWRQRPFNYKYISNNNKAPSIVHAYILVCTHTHTAVTSLR